MAEVNANRELEIARAAAAGAPGAFDDLIGAYGPRLRWLVQLRLDAAIRARVSVEDILQEVLLIVAREIRGLQFDSEPAFWTWLCRVVEQRLVDARRRHVVAAVRDARREQPLAPAAGNSESLRLASVLMDSATSPSGRLRNAEQRQALEAALAALPASYREVIVLRMLEGLSVAETAEIMGRSSGAVSVVLTKAVKRLAEIIAASGPVPPHQP